MCKASKSNGGHLGPRNLPKLWNSPMQRIRNSYSHLDLKNSLFQLEATVAFLPSALSLGDPDCRVFVCSQLA